VKTFLLATEDKEVSNKLRESLPSDSLVAQAFDVQSALNILSNQSHDCFFIDLKLLMESVPGEEYWELFEEFRSLYQPLSIVVMVPPQMVKEAVKAVKLGASDYLTYPIEAEEVQLVVESTYESFIKKTELDYLRGYFWQTDVMELIRTQSPLMKSLYEKIRSVAPTKSTVLLLGETGVGKGVMARLIHMHSNRRDGPFVSVHCAAIPDTLLESQLFGHERGAFTGADRKKLGQFEIAKGGTLFLDEIATLTPSMQIKLLQVLQDGTFRRVGGEVALMADARIISASNRDLEGMCDEGAFRRDLFYRLNVFPIKIPPLRERIEDLPHIVESILKKLNGTHAKGINQIHPRVMEGLKNYPWPGNIRELENLLERAYILESSSMLGSENFPKELFSSEIPGGTPSIDDSLTLVEVRRRAIKDLESRYLKALLARNKGNLKASAAQAGIGMRQLHKLLSRYKIHKDDFRPH
jgi:DNA-binding NtrC family response regulator